MNFKAMLAFVLAGSLATMACAQQPGPAGPGPQAPAAAPRAGGGLPPPEPIEKVTGNIYKIFGGGGNTLVVVQRAGVILVDTKMPGNGEAILAEVKKITDKPVVAIINTHSHPDHIGSTDYIREKYPNAAVYMSEGTKAEILAMPQHQASWLPTHTFKDRMTIGQGDERIELIHTGVGHTQGDAFVLIPSARLLFMGDVMAWNMAPFLPSGGAEKIATQTEALVETVKGQVDIVVEGHGHVNNWEGLVRLSKFNRDLVNFARAAYDRGDPPGVAVEQLKKNPDYAVLLENKIKKGLEYGNTPLARAHMNVNVAYAEFAGETVGFGIANGAPLPATDKHKGSDPKDTAAPAPGG